MTERSALSIAMADAILPEYGAIPLNFYGDAWPFEAELWPEISLESVYMSHLEGRSRLQRRFGYLRLGLSVSQQEKR